MFCGECGTQNPDTNSFCKNCGKPLRKPQPAPAMQPAAAQPAYYPPQTGTAPVVPAAVPAYTHQVPAATPQAPVTKRRNWAGILCLIISLLSWLVYPIILGIVTILTGILGIYLARKSGSRFPVSALIGIVIGLLAIVLNFFWLDIFPPPPTMPPIR
jgi:hypothetical protein